jgi:hypothetical protein
VEAGLKLYQFLQREIKKLNAAHDRIAREVEGPEIQDLLGGERIVDEAASKRLHRSQIEADRTVDRSFKAFLRTQEQDAADAAAALEEEGDVGGTDTETETSEAGATAPAAAATSEPDPGATAATAPLATAAPVAGEVQPTTPAETAAEAPPSAPVSGLSPAPDDPAADADPKRVRFAPNGTTQIVLDASQIVELATPSGERPAPEGRVRNAYETVTKGGPKAAETGAEEVGPAVDERTPPEPPAEAPAAASETEQLRIPDDPAAEADPNVVCSAPNGTTQLVVAAPQMTGATPSYGACPAPEARVRNAYETVTKVGPKAAETGAESIAPPERRGAPDSVPAAQGPCSVSSPPPVPDGSVAPVVMPGSGVALPCDVTPVPRE